MKTIDIFSISLKSRPWVKSSSVGQKWDLYLKFSRIRSYLAAFQALKLLDLITAYVIGSTFGETSVFHNDITIQLY
jgi:hypothetical protein